jgi:putative hydroxymethylpyrimidine transport system permease protein
MRKLWRGGVVFCGLLLLWWLPAAAAFPAFLLPSPSAVAEALWVNRAISAGTRLSRLSEILSGLALGRDCSASPWRCA